MDQQLIEAALAFARETFAEDHSGHDFSHTLRVYRMAVRLAAEEGADGTITALAALLHDVDDHKLSPATAADKTRAKAFLRAHGVPEPVVQAVCAILQEVSFAGRDSVVPATIEGRCVQDADRLDAMGAVGAARAFAYGGSRGRVMHDPSIPPVLDLSAEEYRAHVSTTINHFYEKLLRLGGWMTTATGKALAAERERFMRVFLEEFLAEWDGLR